MIGVLKMPPLKSLRFYQHRSVFNLSKLKSAVSASKDSESTQKYTIHKRFQHPQGLMYDIISRVDLYHEFIPYCTSSFIRMKNPETNEPTVAGLRVGFQAFDEEFTCQLACTRPEVVKASSISHSLFYFLETDWTIKKINEEHCEAILDLKYEFKSELYNRVSRLFASKVANLMTKAFEKRAFEVSKSPRLMNEYLKE